MDGQTQESLSPGWLTPEFLIQFIEELRHEGFNIGVAQYIAAQDMLLMLIARGERLENQERMSSLLGPLLCSSPAEQSAFPEYLARWVERYRASLGREAISSHKETMAEALEETAKRGMRWEWILFIIVVVALIGFAAFFLSTTDSPGGGGGGGVGGSGGGNDSPLPLFGMAATALSLLGLATWAWSAWWRQRANQFLQRRQSESVPELKQISIQVSDNVLFPSLTFLSLARLFRQRVHVVSNDINVVKTVENSVQHGGWLTPVYSHLRIPPEYLVLIDRRSRFDHLAQFMETMFKRLEEQGVFVTGYTFDHDPRLCFPLRGDMAPQSLTELAARYENMRLIIFTEAEGLLSQTNGRLAPWTRLFNRWMHRVVLTPEPTSHWGLAESEINREFIVLQGTEEGLATFMHIVQGQERINEPAALAASALPVALQEDSQRWLARNAPSIDQVDLMLGELRTYLGESGFTWLCACAIYPELHWQITISIGQMLKDANGNPLLEARLLVDLARLPWFRHGMMPDWLRMRLIAELSAEQEEEARAGLEALLVTAVQGHGEALDLEIARARSEWTSRLARPLLQLLRRKSPPDSPIQDHVFLDFMLQRLNLAVRVPEVLRRQLFTRIGPWTGWKILLQWVIANLLVAILLIAIDLLFQYQRLSTDTAWELYGFVGLGLGLAHWWVLCRYWRLSAWFWISIPPMASFASAIFMGYSGSSILIFTFGPLNLLLISVLETFLLARANVPSASLWWLVCTFAGMVNAVWSMFFQIDYNAGSLILFTLATSIVYSMISGWVLLSLLRSRRPSSTFLLRPVWTLANPIGLGLGLLLGFWIIVDLLNLTENILTVFILFIVILFPFALAQALVLRYYHFQYFRAWFWFTFTALSALSVIVIIFLSLESNIEDWEMIVLIGVGVGVIPGVAQALVWVRSGLKPYQSLVWLLCNTLGFSIVSGAFIWFELYGYGFIDYSTFDQLLVSYFLFLALPYGLITGLPLQPFLREALRYQQKSQEPVTSSGVENTFSPLTVISKIRSREPSTRAPL